MSTHAADGLGLDAPTRSTAQAGQVPSSTPDAHLAGRLTCRTPRERVAYHQGFLAGLHARLAYEHAAQGMLDQAWADLAAAERAP